MNVDAEPLVIEFKREVAKMRERNASDLEIQAMLEFVEQLLHWREIDQRESVIKALRRAARRPKSMAAIDYVLPRPSAAEGSQLAEGFGGGPPGSGKGGPVRAAFAEAQQSAANSGKG
jgi:hypothetical protein